MDAREAGGHRLNAGGMGLSAEPAGPEHSPHGQGADNGRHQRGRNTRIPRRGVELVVAEADQSRDKGAHAGRDQPGLTAGQFQRGEAIDEQRAGQAEPEDPSPHHQISVINALQAQRCHQPHDGGNRHQAAAPPDAGRDQQADHRAHDEFHGHGIEGQRSEVRPEGFCEAQQGAAGNCAAPGQQDPGPDAARQQQDESEDEIEVDLVHQGPAHAQNGMGILRHEEEGFHQERHSFLALADPLPSGAGTKIIVDEEHARHDRREYPPERIDPGDAGEEEIKARPEPGLHAVGHIDHDEAGNDKEQVHTGIAIGDEAVQQRQFLQPVLADGQHFHGADMVDDDQQCRDAAQDLDGLKFHAVL